MRPIENAEKIQSWGTLFTIAISVLRSSGAPHGMPMHNWMSTGASMIPSSTNRLANERCPVSKASISGRTPSAVICRAISRNVEGEFSMTKSRGDVE